MANDRFVDILGGSIHCIAFPGLGPAAHFSHANGYCAGTYAPFVSHLTGRLNVLASDLRGHGDKRLPHRHHPRAPVIFFPWKRRKSWARPLRGGAKEVIEGPV